jgi:acetyltransferase-like isoleucine patch superfamily enzyme
MAFLPLRKISDPPHRGIAAAWLEELAAILGDPAADRSLFCRQSLSALFFPEFAADWEAAIEDPRLAVPTRLALAALDPRNITLEPEYYADCDDARFQRVKPLLWLWYSFDRSTVGAQNVWLGVELRRLLAPHIFKRCGENFKAFHNVEFSFGYNMEVGDNVVVHRNVLLDDRGGIVLGNNVSISDFANVYSHTHSIVDQRDVTNATTVLEDGVRVTYHATVLAGTRIGKEGMVGAMAMATKDVRPYHVHVGIPAKSVRVKPNAPSTVDVLRTTRERTTDARGEQGAD